MSECKTINCTTCGFEVHETFLEQKCPRCQSIIESKMACGSCSNCATSLGNLKEKKKSILDNFILLFKKPKSY